MRFVAFDSAEHKKEMRDLRMHVCPGPCNAVAVHLVFDALGYVVNQGSLPHSMRAARKLAHRLMGDYDAGPLGYWERHATLAPITAQQALAANNSGGQKRQRKELWQIANHAPDHMARGNALIELSELVG